MCNQCAMFSKIDRRLLCPASPNATLLGLSISRTVCSRESRTALHEKSNRCDENG